MSIGSITVDLLARTGSFQTDLDRAGKHAQRRMREIEEAVDQAAKQIAIAMPAIGGAAALMVRSAANAADGLSKLSQRTGVAVEELSRLKYAVSLNDATAKDLEQALKGLSNKMYDASRGGKEAAAAFSAIGVQVHDAQGNMRSLEEVLLDIADAFAALPDGANKAAIANKLMEESGVRLIPTLNNGREGIRAMGDELERFGGEVSSTFARAAADFNDNLTRMNALQQSFGLSLANETIPILNELTNALIAIGEESYIASLASAALRTVLETIIIVGANVAYVFKGIGTEIGGIGAQLAALARLDFDAFSAIGQMMKEDAASARAELDAFERRVLGAADAHKALSSVLSDARRKTVDHNGAVERLMSLYQAGTINAKQFQTGVEQLDRIFRGTGRSAGILSDGIVRTGSSAKTAAKDVDNLGEFISNLWREQERAQEQLEQTFEGLRRSYDSVYSQQARFAEGSRVLIQAFRGGLIPSVEELQQQMMMLRDSIYEVEEPIQRLALEVDPIAAAWEEAGKRIDEAFADAWKGAFDSFKSFSDQIKDAFKSLLGELAHMAITRPILVRLGVLSGGAGASGAAMASGGAGGVGGMGFNPMSLLTGNSLGMGISNMLTSAATSNLLAGTGAGNALLGAAGNAAGVSNFALGGAGILGSLGAGLLFGNKGMSSAGGGIGSSIGFAVGGPIGALAGGLLGGVLGSLFGDDDPRYKFLTNSSNTNPGKLFEDGVFVQSAYGNIGFDDYAKNIDANKFQETFQAIAQLDNAIAATLSPSENDRIRQALDGYVSGKDEATADYVVNRLRIITDTVGGAIDQLADQFDGTSEEFVDYVSRLVQARSLIPALQDLGVALDGSSTAATQLALTLSDAFGGAQNAAQALAGYFQNYYTEAERVEVATRRLREAFAAIGVEMPSTREAFRALAAALDLTTEAGRETYAALAGLAPAFAEIDRAITDQATQLQRRIFELEGNTEALRAMDLESIFPENRDLQMQVWALEDALEGASSGVTELDSALQAMIESAQENVSKLQRLSTALRNTLDRLDLGTQASQMSSRQSAQAQIRSALAIARASGGSALPAAEDLSGALSVVARPSEDLFGSFEDYARDFLRTSNDIAELADITDTQLTLEQQALKFLKDRADVEDAFQSSALGLQADTIASIDAQSSLLEDIRKSLRLMSGEEREKQTIHAEGGEAWDGSLRDIAAIENLSGDWAELLGLTAEAAKQVIDMRSSLGFETRIPWHIPGFASGGSHSGGWRMVGESGPELEFTPPSRIFNASQANGLIDIEALVESIERLREDVRNGNVAVATNTHRIARIVDQWEYDGMPAERA